MSFFSNCTNEAAWPALARGHAYLQNTTIAEQMCSRYNNLFSQSLIYMLAWHVFLPAYEVITKKVDDYL